MAFVDIGTTRRRSMTPSRALRIWEAHRGVCVTCGLPIDGVRDRWFVEHVRALELGGEDTDANCGPAHWDCKHDKDAEDHSRAAKAKRAKADHLGIRRPSRLRSRGFERAPAQRTATRPIERKT